MTLPTPQERAVVVPHPLVHRLDGHRVPHVLGRELLLVTDALVPQVGDEAVDRVLIDGLGHLDRVLDLNERLGDLVQLRHGGDQTLACLVDHERLQRS
jgi:hypothetical protein